jgi:hypothetical protein
MVKSISVHIIFYCNIDNIERIIIVMKYGQLGIGILVGILIVGALYASYSYGLKQKQETDNVGSEPTPKVEETKTLQSATASPSVTLAPTLTATPTIKDATPTATVKPMVTGVRQIIKPNIDVFKIISTSTPTPVPTIKLQINVDPKTFERIQP